jgi:hypothetical protein
MTDLAPAPEAAHAAPAAEALPVAPPVPLPLPAPAQVENVALPRSAPPSEWAKAKATPAWLLSGAYFSMKWERDAAGNDHSTCTEADFDAAVSAVGSITINASPTHAR